MKGLLVKDLLILKSQVKVYLMMLAVFAAFTLFFDSGDFRGGFLTGILSMFPVIIPLACMSLDAQSHWDSLCAALPVSRAEIAGERYLLAALVDAVCGALSFCISVAFGTGVRDSLEVMAVLVAMPLAVNAVTLPLMFRFGVEKARVIFVAVMLSVSLGASLAASSDGLMRIVSGVKPGTFLLAAAVLFALSLAVSAAVVRKKEY